MNKTKSFLFIMLAVILFACNNKDKKQNTNANEGEFKVMTEQFADIKILRYQIPSFDSLSLKQKELLYYLYEAALSGRDIIYDQNYRYNLVIRKTLEEIIDKYAGDRNTEDFKKFMTFTKRIWVSNGVHHHYSSEKFIPDFPKEYFVELLNNSPKADYPKQMGETTDDFIGNISKLIFDPSLDYKKTNLNPELDMVAKSAVNYYENLTQKEVEDFYAKMTKKDDKEPISYGLNSKLIKEGDLITEQVWKVGGMYTKAIEKIVFWLEKAVTVTETEAQKAALLKLIEFYKTGDLKIFDEYSILWVKDTESIIDVVNGFIEVYADPLGRKGAFQSVVSIKDLEATKRAKAISDKAQWFEDNAPFDKQFRKKEVKGVTAKVIDVIVESGDCSPTTPIGVNLPNSGWIRKEHGSKSVTLNNIVTAYDESSKFNGSLEEFSYSKEEIEIAKKYASLAGNLHTDLHEIIGHGSGQMKPGIGDPSDVLKNYYSTIEEARADLIALYFIYDSILVQIGVAPSIEVGMAEYNGYIRNGLLVQLSRINLGSNIEESHMRNRQLIAKWVYEKGKAENVIEKKTKDGKTYFVINDYNKLRSLFGELLKEVQRIKSEADYKAAKDLVENYGVIVDVDIHKEVKSRWEKLNIAPYAAFINPKLVPVMENGKIIDVKVEYPADFTEQMMEYAKNYSFLNPRN